jgi:neutral ceramidase
MTRSRRFLRGIAFAAVAVAASTAVLSLPWRRLPPPGPAVVVGNAAGRGPLRAGAGTAPFDLPAGLPIGGFARARWASEGVRDPVGARALYLEVPGCRVAIASAELLLVSEPLRLEVARRVADLRLDALLVGATHTHAGPGGYVDELLAERAALGPFDPALFDRIAGTIAEAVRRAAAAAAPARLAVARGRAEPLVRARSGGAPDGRLLALRLATRAGYPIAELVVFAAHPTTLGQENRRISGDWPGRLAAASPHGTLLLLQGAVGDQSARVPDGTGDARPERYAAALERSLDALPVLPAGEEPRLAVATAEVTLPALSPAAVPALLRPAAATLAWSHLPRSARVAALALGPVRIIAFPAEPTAEVAERWRAGLPPDTAILSLVGGYVGYVETPERTARGEGEAVRTYYGPALAERLGSAARAADRALGPP